MSSTSIRSFHHNQVRELEVLCKIQLLGFQLLGGSGADTLKGGADFICGGQGADTLSGGADDDIFSFARGATRANTKWCAVKTIGRLNKPPFSPR